MNTDRAAQAIMALLERRGDEKTICPSEAARALAANGDFRAHMTAVRDAARALVTDGLIEVVQKHRVVDLDDARGPVRLRAAQPVDDERPSEP